MILHRILEQDLHRARSGTSAVPLRVLIPARASFVPAVVSSPNGRFVICRYLTDASGDPLKKGDGFLPSGVFEHDPDTIDDIVDALFGTAFNLSHDEKWGNIFDGKDSVSRAFAYVREQAGMKAQPHACLVPRDWSEAVLSKYLGKDFDPGRRRYRRTCVVLPCKISHPVFLSRPDFVGQMTQFVGGMTSVVLHNVKHGMSFPAAHGI